MAYKRNVEIFEEAYEKKDAKSVVSYVARDGRRRYIAGNKNPDGGGNMPSGGGITEVTWQELKDKRDNGQLIAGSLYRITDYNGRDLLMQAITSQGEQSRAAVNALSSALGQDFNLVNASIQTIGAAVNNIANAQGMNSLQVINAIQNGNATLANQLSTACCNMQNSITNQTYALTENANRNNQTILDKLSSMETRALQDKLEAARDKNTQLTGEISQLNQNQYIAGVVGQAIAPINAQLATLNKEVDDIKCNMPNTVPVQYPNIVGINATPYMGFYGNYGGNGFWG